jgi:O-antigen/teichoic acid export membrane protein
MGIHFCYSLYSKTYLVTMLGMVVWVLLQRFSDTFLYKIDSILMNVYFGIKMTGIIGAVSEFGTYVTSVTTILSSLFAPLLLIRYSKKQWADYKQMTVDGAYIVGLFSGLLCALLCGSAPTLLELWLGYDFASYGLWMTIKLIVIPYTTAGAMFANGYLYANYNKRPAIVSLILAVLNVFVNICLLHVFSSVIMFLVVCLVFVLMQGLCMNIWFYNHIYKSGFKPVMGDTVKYTIYMMLIMALTYVTDCVFNIHALLQLFVVYLIVFIVGIVVIDSVFLKPRHREMLIEIIPIYGNLRLKITKSLIRS